ncbi:uncharacterized protein LOC124171167 [Ischnura elegans]|uniref:uncharacterized protein LOC124171167 n=1 Tax=Ischnura elegans TaxID=197161 RepID=UPI001ED893A6|nr:uncharacterized protein LOC124171167 [Ischnura elegans]
MDPDALGNDILRCKFFGCCLPVSLVSSRRWGWIDLLIAVANLKGLDKRIPPLYSNPSQLSETVEQIETPLNDEESILTATHNDGSLRTQLPVTEPNSTISPPDAKDPELPTMQVTPVPGVEILPSKVVMPDPTEEQPPPKPSPKHRKAPRRIEKYIPKEAGDELRAYIKAMCRDWPMHKFDLYYLQ